MAKKNKTRIWFPLAQSVAVAVAYMKEQKEDGEYRTDRCFGTLRLWIWVCRVYKEPGWLVRCQYCDQSSVAVIGERIIDEMLWILSPLDFRKIKDFTI